MTGVTGFSSFFFRQLTKDPTDLDRVSRHQRVKTWTRNIYLF